MEEHLVIQYKERKTVLEVIMAELRNAENFDLVIVCKDNRLVHSSRRLLGIWSPMLRNLLGPLWNIEICHLFLPCFSQFTVSKVLRLLTIETEDGQAIMEEEVELLDCLGVPTNNMKKNTKISSVVTDKEYDDDVSSIQKQLLQMIDLSDTSDVEDGEVIKDDIADNYTRDIEEGEILEDENGHNDNESMDFDEEWKYIKKYSEKIQQEYSEQSKNRLRKAEIINHDGNKESKSKLEMTEEYSEEQDNSDFNDSDSTEPYDKKDKEESIEFILSQELEDECFDSPPQYEGFEHDSDDPPVYEGID